MATSVFNRAVAGMSTQKQKGSGDSGVVAIKSAHDLDLSDRIVLSDEITAIRMHQLAITLRPLAGGSAGRPMLTASRWEIRKAIMSLCRTPPTMFEVSGHQFLLFYERQRVSAYAPLKVAQLGCIAPATSRRELDLCCMPFPLAFGG